MKNSLRGRLLTLGAVAASAALLAGCSSGADSPASDAAASGADKPAEETTDKHDLSGETLNVVASWSGDEQANFEDVLDKFAEETGATVNYTSFGDNGPTYIQGQLEGGTPPNVAMIPQPALLESLAKDGDIKPVSDETKDEVHKNYGDSWVDLGSADGELYGVWFKAANKSTVWYNKDIYDGAGATVPESWDDFMEQLQVVTDSGYSGLSVGADVGWPLTDWFENVYLRTAGGEMYDKLTHHEIPWTDDSVAEALEVLGSLWGSDVLQPGGAQRSFPESITEVFGADPQAGTVYEGDFVAGNISEDGNSTVGENALFYDFPSIDGSAPAVVGGGDVAVQFVDDEATNALMTYLASPESAEVWVPKGGLTSPNKSVDTNLYPDEIAKQIAEALTNAETFRFDMSDLTPSAFGGTPGQGFWQEMISFYEDPTDVQGTMERLEEAAEKAYSE